MLTVPAFMGMDSNPGVEENNSPDLGHGLTSLLRLPKPASLSSPPRRRCVGGSVRKLLVSRTERSLPQGLQR